MGFSISRMSWYNTALRLAMLNIHIHIHTPFKGSDLPHLPVSLVSDFCRRRNKLLQAWFFLSSAPAVPVALIMVSDAIWKWTFLHLHHISQNINAALVVIPRARARHRHILCVCSGPAWYPGLHFFCITASFMFHRRAWSCAFYINDIVPAAFEHSYNLEEITSRLAKEFVQNVAFLPLHIYPSSRVSLWKEDQRYQSFSCLRLFCFESLQRPLLKPSMISLVGQIESPSHEPQD